VSFFPFTGVRTHTSPFFVWIETLLAVDATSEALTLHASFFSGTTYPWQLRDKKM
jgi:hypothetical protein